MSRALEKRMMFSFWDGGRGHLARVRNLAIEAASRGHEVSFVTSEKYANELGSIAAASNIHVIENKPPGVPSPPYEFPLYSHAFRHAQRLRGLGFDNVQWMEKVTAQEVQAVKQFRPDVVVNDYRDTIRTSAEVCDVPVVGITHTTGNIKGHNLGSWVTPPTDAKLPDCRPSFNEVRSNHGLAEISDELYMFSGDTNIIPSIPALDPLKTPSNNSHYVGMISEWNSLPGDFRPLNSPAAQNIYSYVGEPTRPSYGYENILAEVIESEPSLGFYVIGNQDRYDSPAIRLRQEDNTVRVAPFIPASSALRDSSVVLSHGGHSTTCLALSLGKPVIGVGAYQSEAATTLRNVANAGAGLFLPHSQDRLERRTAPDLGEDVDIFGYWHTELGSHDLGQAIRTVVEDTRYTERAAQFGEELVAMGGVRRAIDICESL